MALHPTISAVYRRADWFAGCFCMRDTQRTTPIPPPWQQQLCIVSQHAEDLLNTLSKPRYPNELVRRYLVIDLLDLLTYHGVVQETPFAQYADMTGSFADHVQFAWKQFGLIVCYNNTLLYPYIERWARSVYLARQIIPNIDELEWGMLIWKMQPDLVIGPSPVAWEMALPRLMASLFTTTIWDVAHTGGDLATMQQLLNDTCLLQMPAIRAMQVAWRRIHHQGQRHILHLMQHKSAIAMIAARFAWLQSMLYYTLIRGKLARVTYPIPSPAAGRAEQALDQALQTLITQFV